jgi:hypothetical protein
MKHFITYCEIAAFLASLLAWKVIRGSRYLRLFPLLLLVIVLAEAYETFFRSAHQVSNAFLYNVQVPIQHLIYLAILYFAMEGKAHKRCILWFMEGFGVFTIITDLFFTQPQHFNVLAYCVGSVLIIIGIVLKFYEMLETPAEFNFLRNPFFYMLFAFLLFNVGTLPYFTMINWLYFFKPDRNSLVMLSNVMSVLNYILYTTYALAFLWMIRKKASS